MGRPTVDFERDKSDPLDFGDLVGVLGEAGCSSEVNVDGVGAGAGSSGAATLFRLNIPTDIIRSKLFPVFRGFSGAGSGAEGFSVDSFFDFFCCAACCSAVNDSNAPTISFTDDLVRFFKGERCRSGEPWRSSWIDGTESLVVAPMTLIVPDRFRRGFIARSTGEAGWADDKECDKESLYDGSSARLFDPTLRADVSCIDGERDIVGESGAESESSSADFSVLGSSFSAKIAKWDEDNIEEDDEEASLFAEDWRDTLRDDFRRSSFPRL